MGLTQNDATENTQIRRIALVLKTLPQSLAANVLDSLDGPGKEVIGEAIERISQPSVSECREVLEELKNEIQHLAFSEERTVYSEDSQDEFQIQRKAQTDAKQPGLNYQVSSVVSQWDAPAMTDANAQDSFAFLNDIDDDMFVRVLQDEHVQTIALVFSSITPKQAARILPRLDSNTQTETLRRIERLGDVSQAAAAEVARHLRQRVDQLTDDQSSVGRDALQAIMQAMPEDFEAIDEPNDPITSEQTMARSHPSSAEHFEEPVQQEERDAQEFLESLSAHELCSALGKVNTRHALLALCGLPSDASDRVVALLPKPRARAVRRGMSNLESISLREIDQAMRHVAQAAGDIYSSEIQAAA